MQLNEAQSNALINSPDWDMSIADAKDLLKSTQTQQQRRRRTTPNIFTTLSGRAQPRQGFLSLEVMRAIYLRSEVIRACIDTLIEFVSSVDWTIRPIDEDKSRWLKKKKPEVYQDQQKRIEWCKQFFRRPNGYEDLEAFHRRLLRDLLIFDAGAYEIVSADYGDRTLPLELGVVAGDTIEIEADDAGIPRAYWQSYNVMRRVKFEFDELAYLQLNPVSWQPYGVSAIETAFISITSDLNAAKYNSDYFASNGIPPALLAVLGVSEPQFRSVLAQMRQTKQDNPWNVHAFRAQRSPDGNAQKVFDYIPLVQNTNRDMQFNELLDFVTRRICMLFRVSPSQIGLTDGMGGGIGNGIAESQEDLQQNRGVSPLLRKLANTHTYNIIHCILQWSDLEFAWEQSNTPQEESAYQRSIQEVQLGAKTINEHRQEFSGRKPLEWGDAPTQQLPGFVSPQQQQQQMMGLQQQAMGQQPGQQQPPGQQQGRSPAPGLQPPQPPKPPQPGQLQKSADKRIIITF